MGTGSKSQHVLKGTYNFPPGITPMMKSFLMQMQQAPNFKPVKPVTFQEFCTGWKKAKERTSLLGPHFGHYKAGIQHTQIGKLLFQRSQIPMLTGYSPDRHRRGIDVMLLKKKRTTRLIISEQLCYLIRKQI